MFLKKATLGLFIVVAITASTSIASAETSYHRDGRGYTYRSSNGKTTYSYRYDTGATYHKVGNYATYSDNTGTSSTSIYSRYGRYDSFRNSRKGWSGSGYTSYSYPNATTYQHTYGSDSDHGSAGLAVGGLGIVGALIAAAAGKAS